MAITADFGSFLDALKTALEARAALAGVSVRTVPFNQDTEPLEGIQVEGVSGGHSFLSMSPNYRDDAQIVGRLWATIPDTTSDELGVPSRDRAIVLFDELASEIEDDTSGVYSFAEWAWIESYEWESNVVDPPGYRSVIRFTINVIDLTV